MNPTAPGSSGPYSRALLLLLGLLALTLGPLAFPPPAAAHEAPTVEIVAPVQDGLVTGNQVNVMLLGKGGTGTVTFEVLLDGDKVSVDGKVGADATFTTHTLTPDGRSMVVITTLEPGTHEIRIRYQKDPDAPARADVVRRFGSRAALSVDKQRKEINDNNKGAMLITLGALVAIGGVFYLAEKLRGKVGGES